MEQAQYYDGTKLLSLTDLDGNKPELYLVTTNRTGGKTTYFSRLLVNRFLKRGEKFALLYRFNYELSDITNKFFKDICGLFFTDYAMKDEPHANGIYRELFIKEDHSDEYLPCGYAISMNSADQLKKYSHVFSDVQSIMLDEFQSETNHYCVNEIKKFMSIHTTIARGQGKQSRYVPVYLLGNTVSILNPYYTALGIASRLKKDTHFMRGHGWVLESGYVDTASRALQESAFMRAFGDSEYTAYASQNVYLNDNTAFISEPEGRSYYLCTISCDGSDYAIREYLNQGIIYCSDKPDMSFPLRIAVTTEDHRINYVMLNHNDQMVQSLKWLFNKGSFRFKNLACKDAVMKMLSY